MHIAYNNIRLMFVFKVKIFGVISRFGIRFGRGVRVSFVSVILFRLL